MTSQERFSEELSSLNQLFANRYTNDDHEFVEMTRDVHFHPPIIHKSSRNDYQRPVQQKRHLNIDSDRHYENAKRGRSS